MRGIGSISQQNNLAFVNVLDKGADPTRTKDSTSAILAAINALPNGGSVLLPPGSYLSSNILIPSGIRLLGMGPGSKLFAKSGTSGNFIALSDPTATSQVTIEDLWIDGTLAGGSLVGTRLDNTGYSGTDVRHRLVKSWFNGFGGDNIQLGTNVRETILLAISSYNSGGKGFSIESGATDNKFIGCTSGVTLGVGWNILGNNNLFTTCKAFWAGTSDGNSWQNNIDGWFIGGSGDQQGVALVGCESQDNARHGFVFYNGGSTLTNCDVLGCIADSNNAANVAGVGYQFNGIINSAVNGSTAVNRSGGKGTQSYGAQLSGVLTGSTFSGNTLRGATAPYLFSSASGYAIFDTNFTQLLSGLQLATPALANQNGAMYGGSGVPSNSNGSNGDFYYRTDTPGTANQRIYVKSGGSWVGIV